MAHIWPFFESSGSGVYLQGKPEHQRRKTFAEGKVYQSVNAYAIKKGRDVPEDAHGGGL